jgi:hypothetical protein
VDDSPLSGFEAGKTRNDAALKHTTFQDHLLAARARNTPPCFSIASPANTAYFV